VTTRTYALTNDQWALPDRTLVSLVGPYSSIQLSRSVRAFNLAVDGQDRRLVG